MIMESRSEIDEITSVKSSPSVTHRGGPSTPTRSVSGRSGVGSPYLASPSRGVLKLRSATMGIRLNSGMTCSMTHVVCVTAFLEAFLAHASTATTCSLVCLRAAGGTSKHIRAVGATASAFTTSPGRPMSVLRPEPSATSTRAGRRSSHSSGVEEGGDLGLQASMRSVGAASSVGAGSRRSGGSLKALAPPAGGYLYQRLASRQSEQAEEERKASLVCVEWADCCRGSRRGCSDCTACPVHSMYGPFVRFRQFTPVEHSKKQTPAHACPHPISALVDAYVVAGGGDGGGDGYVGAGRVPKAARRARRAPPSSQPGLGAAR